MLRPILTGLAVVAFGSFVLAHRSSASTDGVSFQATPVATQDKKYDFKEPKVQKGDIAVIETNLGTIKFEFFGDKAPKHVANFEKLADAGFYDGTAFHRVVPGFMIQGGDPNTRGSESSKYGQGDPGWKVGAEFNDVSFQRGIVGMARSQDPDSAGSQFFIMVAPGTFLDHQ
jgi:peptidyl-prolyl cis-trans isomerase B (cyclophilin B)